MVEQAVQVVLDDASPEPNPKTLTPRAQAQLLDSLFGTERGLAASSEVRAEINELITQLEAQNPNPSLLEVGGPSPIP